VSGGRVLFVGCGPGAADLLTLRAARALEAADVVVWSASLLDREALAAHARDGVEVVEWPPATLRDVLAVYDRALAEGLLVVRLKGGDPALFGALEPELAAVRERGLEWEIVPGVSALGAGGALLGRQLATPAAPLLLADASALADAVPAVCAVAVHGAGRDAAALQHALLARGLPADASCAVAVEVSRRDEAVVACPLAELAETMQDVGRGLLTIVLAGLDVGAARYSQTH
jgi:precorrin-4/cobalt-precorrin-4 C11-methyltransferase